MLRGLYIAHPYCEYCKVALNADEVSIDHKVPLGRGGIDHDVNNLAITCRDCNYLKHTRTDTEFMAFVKEYAKRFRDNTEPSRESGRCDGQGINPLNAPASIKT